MQPFSLNIKGELRHYNRPAVMGIINVTPDSFYSDSRAATSDKIARVAEKMVEDGADFIDIGAYSTRPGCSDVEESEELRRLELGISAVRKVAPDVAISVDTFRASVAKEAVLNMSADIVNDISGGSFDDEMFATVAALHVPYILMHMRGTQQAITNEAAYVDVLRDVVTDLAAKIVKLDLLGVNDVIVDPGFGFSKSLEQNFLILKNLRILNVFRLPILIGLSRKSMITKLLNITPAEALEGTTALNMYALEQGASILRVHDVAPAVQTVKLFMQITSN